VTIKSAYVPEIVSVLHTTDINLTAKGGPLVGGRKNDDSKQESHKKKKVVVECTSLFLNNNELRNINDLSLVLNSVMYSPMKL
jgi:hypothetical protein